MPTGPQSASASTNFPRGIENGVNWCMGLLQYIRSVATRADATLEAQQRWTAHVIKMCEIMLMRKAKSWFTGYNPTSPATRRTIRYFVYNGGTPKFVGIINDVAAKSYQSRVLGGGPRRVRSPRGFRRRPNACSSACPARPQTVAAQAIRSASRPGGR
jgi:hypothetical protein